MPKLHKKEKLTAFLLSVLAFIPGHAFSASCDILFDHGHSDYVSSSEDAEITGTVFCSDRATFSVSVYPSAKPRESVRDGDSLMLESDREMLVSVKGVGGWEKRWCSVMSSRGCLLKGLELMPGGSPFRIRLPAMEPVYEKPLLAGDYQWSLVVNVRVDISEN